MSSSPVFDTTSPSSHEVADAIRSLNQQEPERYLVRWKGETMEYDSTSYEVTKIGFEAGGRPTLEIRGGRGGNYVIDSNPMDRPLVRYVPPQGSSREERLCEITIYDTRFKWRNQILDRLGF